MKSIGVFCGSSSGGKEIYKNSAIEFGRLLAENNITLVFGAGNIGLMGYIADSVLENGGKTIGVIPKLLTGREITHEGSTETHIVKTMSERKDLIMDISDAFVAMPGGFGTFDELTEVLTHYQLEIFSKPVAILNVAGYFDYFIKQMDFAVKEKFIKKEHRQNVIIDDNPEKLLEKILNFKPIKIDKFWVADLKKKNHF
ncbi:MAG: TIGR00730 family Rossman fold protein [Saprospiraceae bacterium]|nr:TIGR00730 family Rossman fold protein [Saprospiraceae bacterium]